MEDYKALYKLWMERCEEGMLHQELESIQDDDAAILDRFYTKLQFGTAGLRGVLGAGTNRMNIYTVNQATQGIADYLNRNFPHPTVAIAYDSRINSELFAKETAGVFAANGIKAYLYKELVPTPMLSFAIRQLKCVSGVIITASHNPAKYNGYKCYDAEGYQMTDEAAEEAYRCIQKVDLFTGVKTKNFEEGLQDGSIAYVPDEIYEDFFRQVQKKNLNPDACAKADLKVIYTPLNGTGNKPVRRILKSIGVKNVTVVPEQELPDGNFPTCPYPNPEIRQVFECALKMAEKTDADLLLATDPDCDRVGIAVKDGNDYKLMTGNEVGALFTEYVLSQYRDKGLMPAHPVVVESIVTTNLVKAIAASYGAEVYQTLTGFKYIGEYITALEKEGKEDNFVIGMEESYGYLFGTHARDKDAVVASMLICEMASYYKLQGKTLIEVMNALYEKYGIYLNKVDSFEFDGASGMEKMQAIMAELRACPPKEIAGIPVVSLQDYEKTEETGLPASNVLSYRLPNEAQVIVRPSGTEPKIKFYITATGKTFAEATALYEALLAAAKTWLEDDA
ncbi:MAG TPA: phospho-sugar mutase [Clostridiales bacterium]|mgnify:CR=1 FL=1|nr:phospho-sugar mutase [Clostridiales bacterium]